MGYTERPCLKTKPWVWRYATVVPFLMKLGKEDYDEFKAHLATMGDPKKRNKA